MTSTNCAPPLLNGGYIGVLAELFLGRPGRRIQSQLVGVGGGVATDRGVSRVHKDLNWDVISESGNVGYAHIARLTAGLCDLPTERNLYEIKFLSRTGFFPLADHVARRIIKYPF